MIFNFIINPKSGHYSYQEVVDYIRLYAQSHPEFNYQLHLTERVAHATEIARSIHGADNVVMAIGGDGTLNEVLNGLNLECTMGCIPIGSGNDFVKMLKYPQDLSIQEWLQETIEGKRIEVDFGIANQDRFINSCNTGVDANVLIEFNKMRKSSLPNSVVYVIATLKTLRKPISQKLTLTLDDQEPFTTDSLLCTLMNGKYYGDGYMPTPAADIQDGLLELCHVKPIGLMKIAGLLGKFRAGKHVGNPVVDMTQCKKLIIEGEKEILYALDGEIKYAQRVECRLSEQKLKLMVSQRADIY